MTQLGMHKWRSALGSMESSAEAWENYNGSCPGGVRAWQMKCNDILLCVVLITEKFEPILFSLMCVYHLHITLNIAIIFFSLFRTSDFIDILYFMTGFNRTVSSIENTILSVNSVSICETNFLKLHLAISLWNVLVSFSTFTPWNVLSVHSALIHFLILVLFILTILTLFWREMKRITLTHSSSHCYKFLPPHFHCRSYTGCHAILHTELVSGEIQGSGFQCSGFPVSSSGPYCSS